MAFVVEQGGFVLDRLARSQLSHVLLALKDEDRAFNMRDVLDPWWCFERGGGFVGNRQDGGKFARQFNNPCPFELGELSEQFDWRSDAAAQVISLGEDARKIKGRAQRDCYRLIIDHSIPIALITKELWRRHLTWTLDGLREFLRIAFKRAVLTLEDDVRLRNAGLSRAMPGGWKFGDDPFARYATVGIGGS